MSEAGVPDTRSFRVTGLENREPADDNRERSEGFINSLFRNILRISPLKSKIWLG